MEKISRPSRPTVLWVVGIVVWCALLGLLAGAIWMAIWSPPAGQVYQHTWYPVPWSAGSKDEFAATGWFVLIAAAAGMLTAILALFVSRAGDLVTAIAVLAGCCVAAGIMIAYGTLSAPPDPTSAAKTAADGTVMLGTLAVPGWSARACLPLGAAVIFTIWFLMLARPRTDETHPAPLAPVDLEEKQW